MSNPVIPYIQRNIETKKGQVALNDALERLKTNKDFKKVVQEGYFSTEAIRLVSTKGDPDCQTPERQADILRDIDGIGSLQRYFLKIERNAESAAGSIPDDEATLDELRAEALAEKEGE